MYCFTPYATPESLKREVDKFEIESIRENAEWKILTYQIKLAKIKKM